jgi:Na+-driven multidrug efflux pump
MPELSQWRRILAIGLPTGFEIAMMAVYTFLVYTVARPFGPAAQAGFGIGMRLIQAGFMPVVALGFAAAPVAGQNFGARLPERVRRTFRDGVVLATVAMVVFTIIVRLAPAALLGPFSKDPEVVRVGAEYLLVISWTFVSSGVIFVSSSMFQAMGNTMPSLIASGTRMILLVLPVFVLARSPQFSLQWVWYLSLATAYVQLLLALWMLRREFSKRLAFESKVSFSAPVPDSV